VPQPIPPPLVTAQHLVPVQPMQPAPAQLKWLLEQVHMVRSLRTGTRSVNTQAFDMQTSANRLRARYRDCWAGRSNVGTTRRRMRGFIRSAMTTRPGRSNTRSVVLCCVVLAQPCETGLRIAGDYRPAASVPAAAIQLEEASDSVANAAAAATLIAGRSAAGRSAAGRSAAGRSAAGRSAAGRSAAASGCCLWTREPAES
jgi:hypothetical protein